MPCQGAWARDFITALKTIKQIRRCEHMQRIPPPHAISWRPRRAGIYSITLGISARHGLHPAPSYTRAMDQQLMPLVCTLHRLVGHLTTGLKLPGRPIVCLSLEGVRYPAVCVTDGETSSAIAIFRDQIAPEVMRLHRAEEHGLWRRQPVLIQHLRTTGNAGNDSLASALLPGAWGLIARR